jgi:hypothetical protein
VEGGGWWHGRAGDGPKTRKGPLHRRRKERRPGDLDTGVGALGTVDDREDGEGRRAERGRVHAGGQCRDRGPGAQGKALVAGAHLEGCGYWGLTLGARRSKRTKL